MGVVTGIVQEFQFGMNWSNYSRFVGDVFGAPLALEGLLAFFLEATFIGLWIFGWDKLPKGLHLATIWVTQRRQRSCRRTSSSRRTRSCRTRSASQINEAKGRAELTDIWAVLTNKVALAAFPHTIFACFMVAGRPHHLGRRLAPVAQPAPRHDAPGAEVRPVDDGRAPARSPC